MRWIIDMEVHTLCKNSIHKVLKYASGIMVLYGTQNFYVYSLTRLLGQQFGETYNTGYIKALHYWPLLREIHW